MLSIFGLVVISIITCCIDNKSLSMDNFNNKTKFLNNSHEVNSKNYSRTILTVKSNNFNKYPIHRNITSTVFWIGEEESSDNGYIQNYDSVWDDNWMEHYGGEDNPYGRNGFYPNFTPKENPFYVALPYNDFKEGVKKDMSIYKIYWNSKPNESACKNRWVKITKGNVSVYAQWEDAGPFGEDDYEYVFGNRPNHPKNKINNNAGIDVSPAVRDYLNLSDIDKVNWQFVDYKDVPDGPWKKIITKSNIYWK
jgi:hypothetical protein